MKNRILPYLFPGVCCGDLVVVYRDSNFVELIVFEIFFLHLKVENPVIAGDRLVLLSVEDYAHEHILYRRAGLLVYILSAKHYPLPFHVFLVVDSQSFLSKIWVLLVEFHDFFHAHFRKVYVAPRSCIRKNGNKTGRKNARECYDPRKWFSQPRYLHDCDDCL